MHFDIINSFVGASCICAPLKSCVKSADEVYEKKYIFGDILLFADMLASDRES